MRRLVRLLGGVVLTQGRLPHQVLGQLLLLDTDEVAIAGAAVVFAGTTRQRNVLAQAAIRTALPALALRGLFHGEERRLERLRDAIQSKEREIERHARLAILMGQRRRRLGPGATAAVLVARGRPEAAVLERSAARLPASRGPKRPPRKKR